MENVDKTIDTLCNCIQEELKSGNSERKRVAVEMVKALAELISARAKAVTFKM